MRKIIEVSPEGDLPEKVERYIRTQFGSEDGAIGIFRLFAQKGDLLFAEEDDGTISFKMTARGAHIWRELSGDE